MKLNVREAARLLSMSESELYRLIDDGAIPCHLVNRVPMFSQAEILEWATARRRPVSVDLFEADAHAAGLAAALAAGGVHTDVVAADRSEVLRAMVERLPIPEAEDREMLHAILAAREAEVSTGVGNGIAIPHVRSPVVFADRPAAIAVLYLAQPVAFGSIDGAPIHTVLAMMTPTIDIHLQLLARLSLALHDDGFVAALARRADQDAIVAAARAVEDQVAARARTPA